MSSVMGEFVFRKALRDLCKSMLDEQIPLAKAMKIFEDQYIDEVLAATGGNVTRASRRAGVHRNTLHNKLRNG